MCVLCEVSHNCFMLIHTGLPSNHHLHITHVYFMYAFDIHDNAFDIHDSAFDIHDSLQSRM